MTERKLSKILFVLCLICAFALSLNIIHLGRADVNIGGTTIYVRANGSIEPVPDPGVAIPIVTSDDITYTLTDNIIRPGGGGPAVIRIERSHIILDGAGYNITGPGKGWGVDSGVRVSEPVYNVTVRNIGVGFCGIGVHFEGSTHDNNVSFSNLYDNLEGVRFQGGTPTNNLVLNNTIANNNLGVWIGCDGAGDHNSVFNNTITATNADGIRLYDAVFTDVQNNTIALGSNTGIEVARRTGSGGSHNVTIKGNTIQTSGYLVYVSYSHNATISNNTLNHNWNSGGWGAGIYFEYSSNNTVTQNTIQTAANGIYCNNEMDNSNLSENFINHYNSPWGVNIYLGSSSYNRIFNNTLNSTRSQGWSGQGLLLQSSSNHNDILNNTIGSTPWLGSEWLGYLSIGIQDQGNAYNTYVGNTIKGCTARAMELWNGDHHTALENKVDLTLLASAGVKGIWVGGAAANNNNVTGNDVECLTAYQAWGIYLSDSATNNVINENTIVNAYYGIIVTQATNNGISGNNVTGSSYAGICLNGGTSNNIITDNKVVGNHIGIEIAGAYSTNNGNSIYHNDFVSNTQQVNQAAGDGSANTWDNGYPSGGNYWSDYSGIDIKKEAAQNVDGADGIGDTSYTTNMAGSNMDHYPFMTVFFNQTGISSDFTEAFVNVGGTDYKAPVSFMWDPGTTHNFHFYSPLEATPNAKQYVWDNTTGLSTLQSDSALQVPFHGSITGNYKTQFYLTMSSNFGSTSPVSDWHDSGSVVNIEAYSPSVVAGERYVWNGWTGTGTISYTGMTNQTSVTMNSPISEAASWTHQYLLTVVTAPSSLSPQPSINPLGEAGPANSWWYNADASVQLTAQLVTGYAFSYWDVDAVPRGSGVNPISVVMSAPHNAIAHYTSGLYPVYNLNTGLGYATIQQAIDADETLAGHTISVSAGTYSEHVVINKAISLVGENRETTIINAGGSGDAVYVSASNVVIANFTITNGERGIFVESVLNCSVSGSKITGNTIVGINVAWSTDCRIFGSDVRNNKNGISVDQSLMCRIYENNFTQNIGSGNGIEAYNSLNCTITGNSITANSENGIFLEASSNSTVSENDIAGNSQHGVILASSFNCTISRNNMTNNGWTGIYLDSSGNNTLVKNRIAGNSLDGIKLVTSEDNNVTENNIVANSQYGISLTASSNENRIFHNNFTSNVVAQAKVEASSIGNIWDDGYPSGGNFWSDYAGVDEKHGPGQNEPGSDGIGDTPYSIDATNQDNYPFTNPWTGTVTITFTQTGVSSDFTGTILTVDGTPYTFSQLPVSFTWNIGESHTFSYQSPLIVLANSKQYVWTSTTGISIQQSDTIAASTSGTITGNCKTQYYLTVDTSPPSLDAPTGENWYDAGATAHVSTAQYVDIVPGSSRYRFDSWTGATGTFTDATVIMDSAKTATANYVTQYKITFDQFGLTDDASGTVVTVDTAAKTYGDLPFSHWVDESDSITYSYSSPVASAASPTDTQYRWVSTSGLGQTLQSNTFTVSVAGTVTGNYLTQYYLTVASLYGSPTGQGWYDSGSTAASSVSSPVSGGAGIQYVAAGYTGTGSAPSGSGTSASFTITAPSSVTWNWQTQYYLTVSSAYGAPGGEGWYDTSDTAYATVTPLTVPGPTDTQYVFTQWSDDASGTTSPSNPITMDAPKTATANWKTQYYVAFAANPTEGGTTNATGSYDQGANSIYASPAEGYSFSSWSSTGSISIVPTDQPSATATINGPGTITANFGLTTVSITITSSPTGSGYVKVDDIAYTMPQAFTWTIGDTHKLEALSPVSGGTGIRYVWISWSDGGAQAHSYIVPSSSETVTANYKTQYLLTIKTSGLPSPYSTPINIAGTPTTDDYGVSSINDDITNGWRKWFDASPSGTGTVGVNSPVDGASGTRYAFKNWSDSSISNPHANLALNAPLTLTVNYKTQYQVTFDQAGLDATATGTVVKVGGAPKARTDLPFSDWFDSGTAYSYSTPVSSSVSGNRFRLTGVTGPASPIGASGTVAGNYVPQHLLTVRTDPSGLSPQPARIPAGEAGPSNGWWYDTATSVQLTAQTVTGYTFNYWDVDAASMGSGVNPINVDVSVSHTATAHYTSIGPENHDVAITKIALSKSVIGQAYSMYINATVQNQGDFAESFTVTLYANTKIILSKSVSLAKGTSTILTFKWDTTGWSKGSYTIKAVAQTVTGETDTSDNTLIDGTVFISIPGDINGDKRVNSTDLLLMTQAILRDALGLSWNPNADINNDGHCNSKDLTILLSNFGKRW